MRRLKGRVAVVTGAASGIGRATASLLAKRGCALALVDIAADELEAFAAALRKSGAGVSVHIADVADKDRMQRLPEEVVAIHEHVHILVNNAGVSVTGSVEEQSLEDFEWVVGINLWGVVYGCKFFLPYLRREEEGHIVNLSSVFGILGMPTQGSYNATKFAVRGLSEALHGELADTAIGVTCVHPGAVQTNIVRSSRMVDPAGRERAQATFDRRGTSPEVVAEKIVSGIDHDRLRVLVCPETYMIDWMKRLFPTLTHKLVARQYRHGELPL